MLCWRWRSCENASSLCQAWVTSPLQREKSRHKTGRRATSSGMRCFSFKNPLITSPIWGQSKYRLVIQRQCIAEMYITWNNFQEQHEFQAVSKVFLDVLNLCSCFPQVGVTPRREGLGEKGREWTHKEHVHFMHWDKGNLGRMEWGEGQTGNSFPGFLHYSKTIKHTLLKQIYSCLFAV